MRRKHLFICLTASVALSGYFSADTYAQSTGDSISKIIAAPSEEDKNIVFEKAEVEASVDLTQWRKHLEASLPSYLEEAARKNMKAGQYTVYVRFIVERNGNISDVKALNDPGYGLAIGAARAVRTGPKWKAAEQNGRKVRSYHTQPITFSIEEEKKNKKGDN